MSELRRGINQLVAIVVSIEHRIERWSKRKEER